MPKQMWFGNEKRMQWVPAPATGMQVSRPSNGNQRLYDNGRAGVFRSMQSHLEFEGEFPLQEASGTSGLDVFSRYASGLYGDSDSYPVFFADPMHYDQNLLPANFAAPGLIERGWADISYNISRMYYNFARNPSVEVNTNDWAVVSGTGGAAVGARVGGTWGSGSWVYRATWTTATTSVSGGVSSTVNVTAGTVTHFRMYVRPSKTQRLQMSVTWRDAANASLGTVTGVARVVTTANEPPMELLAQTAPAGAVSATVSVLAVSGTSGTNWAIGDYLQGDAVQTANSTNQGISDGLSPSYFDGSYIGARWMTGTAHNTSSQMFVPSSAPAFSDTPANSYNLPLRQATFSLTEPAGSVPSPFGGHPYALIPIPPGYTLWVGATGSASGTGGVRVYGYNPPASYTSPATTQTLTLLSSAGAQRMNYSLPSSSAQYAKIFINRTDYSTSTITLSSMMAQLWPTGVTPVLATATGGQFIDGRGHRGLKFAPDGATVESYVMVDPTRNSPVHYKGLSLRLIEAQDRG